MVSQDNKTGTLTLLRGVPGSGKSTLAQSLIAAAASKRKLLLWYEADMYFMVDGQYVFDTDKLYQAHKWCQQQTQSALSRGLDCVVSNTFTTKKELRPYFDMAHELKTNPVVICMQSNFGSIHNVPEESLAAMKNRFVYNIDDMFVDFSNV